MDQETYYDVEYAGHEVLRVANQKNGYTEANFPNSSELNLKSITLKK